MVRISLSIALALVASVALVFAVRAPGSALPEPQRALTNARSWLNTSPLRPQDLRGKVILVNFWTYSCINSARALPYVRAWADKYRDQGLVVIGVHTPEFEFEKNLDNVRRASADAGVHYPVVLDNDFTIWRTFNNDAWPAFYFIGADGAVRRRAVGEGNYDQSERVIQTLLSEARGAPVVRRIDDVAGQGPQAPADFQDLNSPETFIGYGRSRGFAPDGGVRLDAPGRYTIPEPLALNRWALSGQWNVGQEFATASGASTRVAYRFHARDLHLIMASPAHQTVRFRVSLDGKAPGPDHGVDVDADGWGHTDMPRMYQLIRQGGAIKDRTFAIEFFEPGVRVYDFTFG